MNCCKTELWDALDCEGRLLNRTLVRGEAIPEGLYHTVSCVFVRHTDGSILLMRRSPDKEVCPNRWEIGAAGSALQGESAEEAARRELLEETGIDRGTWSSYGTELGSHSIYRGFLCVTDFPKDQIRLQEGETTDFCWLSREEFLFFFYSEDCIPSLHNRLLPHLEELINP